ncbi:hypothetical protein [Halobacteriaceae bacterium SHR40]|uniref:hypothetical protein n=1 Tax=Halovenus amylolytica TaxID=2500550 RepID=UPI000FE3A5F6
MKIILDSDAAVFIAGTSLCEDFFSQLPACITHYCFKNEIPGLKNKPRRHVRRGAEEVLDRVSKGDIEVVPSSAAPTNPDKVQYEHLSQKYELDAGELSILRCLLWDASEIAVVAAQDSDARSAITTLVQKTQIRVQVGSPATALGLLVAQDDALSVGECLDAMESQVQTEGWNWSKLKAEYENEIKDVQPD